MSQLDIRDIRDVLIRFGSAKLTKIFGDDARLEAIFSIMGGSVTESQIADIIVAKYGSRIFVIPPNLFPNGAKAIDVDCYQCSKDHVEKEPIREWLAGLEYPLYYLDYETLMPAIPLFNGTRPFQQVPFQFSLHVQESPNAELKHFEFIHKEQSEPREAFAKGNISPEQLHILWKNLSESCKLDTYAMIELLEMLKKI